MAATLSLKDIDQWTSGKGVTLVYTRQGKPTDNPYIESFNGSFHDEYWDCIYSFHWKMPEKILRPGGTNTTASGRMARSEI